VFPAVIFSLAYRDLVGYDVGSDYFSTKCISPSHKKDISIYNLIKNLSLIHPLTCSIHSKTAL